MPELPEVQTVVDDLNKKIKGDKIAGFWSDWKKTIKKMSGVKFTSEIKGRKILGARRIGKNIFIDLSEKDSNSKKPKKTLYIHLKMTGHLLVKTHKNSKSKSNLRVKNKRLEPKKNYFNDKVNQYIHHIWYLEDKKGKKKTLEFSDLRKFGKIMLLDTKKIEELPEIKNLGMDVMSKSFTLKKFKKILEKKNKGTTGLILMDQTVIAGIGNIYRSEILFEAGINPNRKVVKLKKDEIKKLFYQIKKVLRKAIKMRGTSDSDYRDTSGAPGRFHKVLKVYRRDGKKCKKCANIIKRIKMGQRSVFYCSQCQK